MEEQLMKFLENLPNLLKTVALIGIVKGVIGIYTILHKENKQLRQENFELKDLTEDLEKELVNLKLKKICNNCKELEK